MRPYEEWTLKIDDPDGGEPIKYLLKDASPKGSFEEETGNLSEVFIIRTEDFLRYVRATLSDYVAYPGGSWDIKHMGRMYLPEGAVPPPGLAQNEGGASDSTYPIFVAKKVGFEPFPETGGRPGNPLGDASAIRYSQDGNDAQNYAKFLLVTTEYSPGKSTMDVDDLLEISCHATGEFLCYSARGRMSWGTQQLFDGEYKILPLDEIKDINLPITRMQPGVEWSLKYKRVPWDFLYESVTSMREAMGKVNSDTMSELQDAEPGTIMFVSFSYTTVYSWRGLKPFVEIEVKLLEKRVPAKDYDGTDIVGGHNYFLRPSDGPAGQPWAGTFQLVLDSSKNPVYQDIDLGKLLFDVDNT